MIGSSYSAVIQQDGQWWIGWIEEIPGVNSQGATRKELNANLFVKVATILSYVGSTFMSVA